MLKLRQATVVSIDPLTVDLAGEQRPAWADTGLVGACEVGDLVVVNTEARDLGLGSGGFDIVHVNLTRGLDGEGAESEHVMKLNYSSLQHPVATIERPVGDRGPGSAVPVLAIGLHGHLAPAAWAARAASDGGQALRIAYVQTGGGALPGSMSDDVKCLLDSGLIAGHITAGPAYGGQSEAISLVGALDAAGSLGFDGVMAGPGPGILGSATTYGHGGMAALDAAHAGLSLGAAVAVSARLSSSDPRPRHRGLSHHTRTVLELLLEAVVVPVPEGRDDLAEALMQISGGMHRVRFEPVDLDGYCRSGLPRNTMGRDIDDDPDFFSGSLAAGAALFNLIGN